MSVPVALCKPICVWRRGLFWIFCVNRPIGIKVRPFHSRTIAFVSWAYEGLLWFLKFLNLKVQRDTVLYNRTKKRYSGLVLGGKQSWRLATICRLRTLWISMYVFTTAWNRQNGFACQIEDKSEASRIRACQPSNAHCPDKQYAHLLYAQC